MVRTYTNILDTRIKDIANDAETPIIIQILLNRVVIDNRSEVVNNKEDVGDFKENAIIGKNHKGAIVILDDRKTKLHLAMAVQGKNRSG